ncbi:MAG: TolC family protein [Treponema sp.]|jgi:outer membrane protein TolC|nr:TolC family protein [Treponema sp.]
MVDVKKISVVFLLFIGITLFSLHGQSLETGLSLNLEEYLERVKANNLDIVLSGQNILSAAESIKQARSAFLPSIGATGGYIRNLRDRLQSTPVAANGLEPVMGTPGAGIYPLIYEDRDANYDNELTAAVVLDQKIFDAAALARYRQSKTGKTMQETVFDYTRQMVITAAKKLYAQTQLTEAVLAVMKEAENASEETYRNIERMYTAGTTTELNLLMAEVDWKNNSTAVFEAERNMALVMLALKNLANIPPETAITLTEEAGQLPELPSMPDLINVFTVRPDYHIQLLSKELADEAYRASIGTFLPTVSARFAYAYGNMGGYEGKGDWNAMNYSVPQVSLNITIPLFTGGYRTSLVRNANINREQAEITIQKKRNEIEQEMTSLMLKMREAQQKMDSAGTLETAALRAMALAQISLENGMGTRLAVSEASANLSKTRLNFQNAVFEYRSAYYDWLLAVGCGADL